MKTSLRSNNIYNVMDASKERNFLNKLDVTVNMAYTRVKSTGISTNSEFGSVLGSALYMAPTLAPTVTDGNVAKSYYDKLEDPNVYDSEGKVIETKRLILRSFKQTDLEDFYEYASVEGVGEMAGWKHHENIAESQSIMNSFISEDKAFAICLKKNNKVIGTVGIEKYGLEDALTEFKDYYGRELGYVLSKDYWGKGLMPEAVNAVKDYLFGELDYDFLICGYYDFNEQSKRVQTKCGFKPYRSLVMTTQMETKEQGTLMLLLNSKKNIKLVFSHPETLISENW